MARAMRASVDRKPKATRVSSRIWVFTDSMRALESRYVRAARMPARLSVMVLTNSTKG